ncbi:MAG: phosphodiester glycosidase family protein [Solobacterium sp.]|nr:phosphodiester glycosidase family protein [Solobacterium sp.]
MKEFLKKYWKLLPAAVILLVSAAVVFILNYRSKPVTYSWDEKEKDDQLSRDITTAINVYTDGTVQEVFHETGSLDGIQYDMLRVLPSEHTFLQVDYSEEPKPLIELADEETIAEGYAYAGGINGGFFYLTGKEYGRPVGAVRRKNAWTKWHGEENTPAYGSGFATAYFTGDTMRLKYHGWQKGVWMGDEDWTYESGYAINAENGISGSYTYIVDGKAKDITGDDYGIIDYRTFGRAATIFAQNADHEYMLIDIFGVVDDKKILKFLQSLDTVNALRMDGGISTQMVYMRKYVTEIR